MDNSTTTLREINNHTSILQSKIYDNIPLDKRALSEQTDNKLDEIQTS